MQPAAYESLERTPIGASSATSSSVSLLVSLLSNLGLLGAIIIALLITPGAGS